MPNFDALRSMVSRFLVDTCTVTSPAATAFDPDDGYSDATGATVYTGPCRVARPSGPQQVEAGEDTVTLGRFDVTLPWDTVALEVNQLVTVTASGDPFLIGRVLRVIDVQGMSDAPYRRLVCEDTRTQSEVA